MCESLDTSCASRSDTSCVLSLGRACQQSDKKEACVHILASLHQYEQAVDLALEIRASLPLSLGFVCFCFCCVCRGCVLLRGQLCVGAREVSVTLKLTVFGPAGDIELAKLNADKVEDDDDLRKRMAIPALKCCCLRSTADFAWYPAAGLWLRIARYVSVLCLTHSLAMPVVSQCLGSCVERTSVTFMVLSR